MNEPNANPNPCNQCPYRKESLKGYLGNSSYDPELFLGQLDNPDLHPCHMVVDWENENEDLINAKKCTGALQFMNNSMMIHRNKEMAELQKTVGKNEDVMQFKHNFIKHHS